jgi:phosphoribosylpyrophosphate synthetase
MGALSLNQRSGDHRRTGMQAAPYVGIVEIEGMGERAVEQGSLQVRISLRVADHRCIVVRALQRHSTRTKCSAALRIDSCERGIADEIEQTVLEPFAYDRRHTFQSGRCCKTCQRECRVVRG